MLGKWIRKAVWIGLAASTLPRGIVLAEVPGWPDVLQPFWQDATMRGEGMFFIQQGPTERPTAPLLFTARKVLRVVQPCTGKVFEPGRDYTLASDGKSLLLPEGSGIPFKTRQAMYPPPGAPRSIRACRDGKHHLFFSEGHVFHDLQVEVTYTHDEGEWKTSGGYVPTPAGAQLPGTMGKLRRHEPITLALLGDSISAGGNASGFTGARPHMPPYGQLVARGLETRYGSKVTLKNFSVGGKASGWGVSVIDKVAAVKPDLVLLAFGMNDASGRVPAEGYAANTRRQIDAVRSANPAAEFILVATMTGNPEWTATSMQHYVDYRAKLRRMTGKGIALADVTSLWQGVLRRKRFADLTGNGVNHPNDFGHRLYAQVILALLR